jgi:hypothetical protein
MALDSTQSAALMRDTVFQGRIKFFATKYADFVSLEAPTTERHTAAIRWVQRMYAQPDLVAGELQPLVVADPAVQAAGAEITDAALGPAVEAAIKRTI